LLSAGLGTECVVENAQDINFPRVRVVAGKSRPVSDLCRSDGVGAETSHCSLAVKLKKPMPEVSDFGWERGTAEVIGLDARCAFYGFEVLTERYTVDALREFERPLCKELQLFAETCIKLASSFTKREMAL
jgi:hypothetical protein